MTIIFLYGSDERNIAAAAIAGLIISLFIALYHKSKNKRTEKEQLKATALDNLKDKGIISEQEYNDKINEIQDKYLSSKIKSTKEYRQLIELKKEGLLNDNDFSSKIKILKERQRILEQELNKIVSYKEIMGKWNYNEVFYNFGENYNFSIIKNNKTENGSWGYNKEKDTIKIILPNKTFYLNKIRVVNNKLRFIKFGKQFILNRELK